MYTYIYTENHMNFYRTGKVIGVTGGVSYNLESSQFKHKAIMVPNGGFTGTVQLFGTFYDTGGQTSLGMTLACQANTSGQYPYIIPAIFRSVRTNFDGRLVLLS